MCGCAEQVQVETQLERTNGWLRTQLLRIWDDYFDDIPRVNRVEIQFARRWKTRLGMITMSHSGFSSYIGINQLLNSPTVPDEICWLTIAHELVHYAHGFGSPLPRKYRHPHHGNIVSQELAARGLGKELMRWEEWTKQTWYPLYYSQARPIKALK